MLLLQEIVGNSDVERSMIDADVRSTLIETDITNSLSVHEAD